MRIIMVMLSVVVLGVFNFSIYQKEQVLRRGDTVLLELAPVDPRSLMQGDYMILAFAIERAEKPKFKEPYGKMVIKADENNVAQFVRFFKGEFLKDGERLLPFRNAGFRVDIRPSSFFFQEGNREIFEQAKYGIYKFDKDNNYILIGLADKDRKEIKPKK